MVLLNMQAYRHVLVLNCLDWDLWTIRGHTTAGVQSLV